MFTFLFINTAKLACILSHGREVLYFKNILQDYITKIIIMLMKNVHSAGQVRFRQKENVVRVKKI